MFDGVTLPRNWTTMFSTEFPNTEWEPPTGERSTPGPQCEQKLNSCLQLKGVNFHQSEADSSLWPSNPTPWKPPWENVGSGHQKTSRRVVTAALSTVAPTWEVPKCPPPAKWVTRWCSTHSCEAEWPTATGRELTPNATAKKPGQSTGHNPEYLQFKNKWWGYWRLVGNERVSGD